MKIQHYLSLALICGSLVFTGWILAGQQHQRYPETTQIPCTDHYHGTEVVDCYQWLEDGNDPLVQKWVQEQNVFTLSKLKSLPQHRWLFQKLNALSRHDEMTFHEVLIGDRRFIWSRKANEERRVVSYQDLSSQQPIILLNSNEWVAETLEFATPSRDGTYLVFAKAKGGDENPVIQIMEVETKKILPDTLKGSKQGWPERTVAWLPDNTGFFYAANPLPGEVTTGEENYWNSVYFHRLGTLENEDIKVFSDPACKEHFHYADVSEDGKWVVFTRSRMGNATQIYLSPIDQWQTFKKPVTTTFDAAYRAFIVEDKLLVLTNKDAPNYKLYVSDLETPSQENWKELIPEKDDRLMDVSAIGGRLYLHYLHHASSLLQSYDLEGKCLSDISLPSIGSASVEGYWSKPSVWLDFSSFIYPSTRFLYQPETQQLELVHTIKIPFSVDDYTLKQIWYPSKDGTLISMFLLHHRDLEKNGKQAVLLTGYGGFDISITPTFSEGLAVFLEAGGMVAIPNLRGGGEYGRAWHEAGMKHNKQNVFDDFIAAAEWLNNQGYTNPSKIGIRGGSNGGLLVGAALTQRPELFQVAICEVPLLDMLRYHRFGFANIWSDEYGNADDPEQFQYLYRYSPYHCIRDKAVYPATLVVGAENDSRVDPLHARKMVARLQTVDPEGGPHLLFTIKESGHTGATTVTAKLEQRALILAFLLNQIDLKKE